MLKTILKQFKIVRLPIVPVMHFCKPFYVKEQQFYSDSESDLENDTSINDQGLFQQFKNTRSVKDVLEICKQNEIQSYNIHIPSFQLSRIINNNCDDPLVYEFANQIKETIAQQSPEQLLVTLGLYIKLRDKKYVNELKQVIFDNFDNFTHIQLSYLFLYFVKINWNVNGITYKLKQHISNSQFTAHSLMQIIRACYTYEKYWRGSKFADLCFQAQKVLLPLIINLNIHSQVSIFFQLARMRLHKTTSHKRFPQLLNNLNQYFIQNQQMLSIYQQVKLIEAFIFLPDFFDSKLYQNLTPGLLQNLHQSQTQLKIFLTYALQRPQLRPSEQQLLELSNKIQIQSISPNLLLKYLEYVNGQQYTHKVAEIIQALKSQDMSQQQKLKYAALMIKHDFIDQGLDLLLQGNENLWLLTQQAHTMLQKKYKITDQSQQNKIDSAVQKLVQVLREQQVETQKYICFKLLDFEPQRIDPLYDFLDEKLQFNELDFYEQIQLASKLANKQNLNLSLRTKVEKFQPTIDQLKQIINNISNVENVTDKYVKYLSVWLHQWIEKGLIDESLDLNLAVDLFVKILINAPTYSIHNMRGTVVKHYRDLIQILSKQVYLSTSQLTISIIELNKINNALSLLNVKTSFVHNLIQNFVQHSSKDLSTNLKFQLCEIISQTDPNAYSNIKIISQILVSCQEDETISLTEQVQKTLIQLYLTKNSHLFQVIKVDEVLLREEIEALKEYLIQAKLPTQKEYYIKGIMAILDYDGWCYNYLQNEEDNGLQQFIENHFNAVEPYLNMRNMRSGLKAIIKTIGFYESKHDFLRKYQNLFSKMFSKCKVQRNSEKIHISVCLDYLEFAKKLKISDNSSLNFLIDKIIENIDSLRQVQIVDTIQKFCELKIVNTPLFDQLSNQIISRIQFYSTQEQLDALNAFSKLGYFNFELTKIICQKSVENYKQNNKMHGVQYLWGLILQLRMNKINRKPQIKDKEQLLTYLLDDMLKFTEQFNQNLKIPLMFRQYIDLYNIFFLALHTELDFNISQTKIVSKIIEKAGSIVVNYMLTLQKTNGLMRGLSTFFEEAGLEFKQNYLFDQQYVDYYLPQKKLVYIVDNSLYTSLNLEQYSGFHYFNEWIMEAISKKYEVRVIRINAWKWYQLSIEEKRKVLEL